MTNQSKYHYWLENNNTEPTLKAELAMMNEQQIEDAFYTNIEFGTAGMRGILGAGTNRINIHTIRKANRGFIKYIVKHQKESLKEGVVIGYDNRHMSYELALDSAKLMASHGIKVSVFESLRPTPELSYAVRYLNCFGGIMITASHNPKEYNGYKLYDETGCQLVPALADEVIQYVDEIEDPLAILADVDVFNHELVTFVGEEIDEAYYAEVLAIQLHKDIAKPLKIVFSPEHGASHLPVLTTLQRAGYEVILVEEQSTFDPDFSNTESPNPEELKAYKLSLEYAVKYNADLILVCDPDGDRMGVAAKNPKGEFVVLTGNQSGAILIEYILSQRTALNNLPKNAIMFNTVVTSDLGEKIATHYGVETEKTLTGFKFIGEKVAQYEKTKAKTYVFGYEESYGSLIKDFVRDKDATQACLMLAEAACFYASKNKTLVNVLNDLYDLHGAYDETQTSMTFVGQQGQSDLKALIENLRTHPPQTIDGLKVVAIEDYGRLLKTIGNKVETLRGFVKSDVLKYFLEDGSWIAIRPSGTEPKCKIYYCITDATMEKTKIKTERMHQAMKIITKS